MKNKMININCSIDKAVIELLNSEPFYAYLLMNINRIYTTEIETFGINVKDNILNLYINPYVWNSLNLREQVSVLKHELLHVIMKHFNRFEDLQLSEKKNNRLSSSDLLNIAADYAVNELLPELPQTLKLFDKDGNVLREPEFITLNDGTVINNPNAGEEIKCKLFFVRDLQKYYPKVKNNQNMEYYYDFIKNNNKRIDFSGFKVVDNHNLWNKGDNNKEMINEVVKETIKNAIKEAKSDFTALNKIPYYIKQYIDSFNYIPKDWRLEMQKFTAKLAEVKVMSSRKKRNRRYGYIFPGNKIYQELTIFIGIDVSGSIDDDLLNQFFSEVNRIYNLGVKLIVGECDTRVTDIYEYSPNLKTTIIGRGGTLYAPLFEEANKYKIDGLIYLTDGKNYDEILMKPKYQVLWALPRGCDVKYDWGMKTFIDIKKGEK